MAEPFLRHTGIAAPFLLPNVDVQDIAPLAPGTRPDLDRIDHRNFDHGFSHTAHSHEAVLAKQTCFDRLRYFPDGSERPEFLLNQAPYRDASILLAGENFGIGGIEVFAAVRLRACGFRSILAPSFGQYFYRDCFDYGLLPVILSHDVVASIAERVVVDPEVGMTVDLQRNVIERPGMKTIPFAVIPRLRKRLLLGVGDLDEMLEYRDRAEDFRNESRNRMPWAY